MVLALTQDPRERLPTEYYFALALNVGSDIESDFQGRSQVSPGGSLFNRRWRCILLLQPQDAVPECPVLSPKLSVDLTTANDCLHTVAENIEGNVTSGLYRTEYASQADVKYLVQSLHSNYSDLSVFECNRHGLYRIQSEQDSHDRLLTSSFGLPIQNNSF